MKRKNFTFGWDLLLTAGVNLVASLMMKYVLEGATMAGGTAPERLAYIASNRRIVIFGWGTWVAATITLLLAFWVWNLILNQQLAYRLRFAFAIAIVGSALDIAADVLQMSVIPYLAGEYVRAAAAGNASGALPMVGTEAYTIAQSFGAWDTAAVALTGGAGNTLYAVAGLIVTSVMFETPWVPRWYSWWGAAVWVVAFVASILLFWFPRFLPFGVAAEMILFIAWASAFGVFLLRLRKFE